MTSRAEVRIHQDGREWAREACECLRSVSEETIRSRGRVLIALSGGSDFRPAFGFVAALLVVSALVFRVGMRNADLDATPAG